MDTLVASRSSRTFAIAAAALCVFAAFMLVRPLVGGGGSYGPRPRSTGYAYAWLVLASFAPYVLALAALRRGGGPSLGGVIAAAAAVSLPLVLAPLTQSQDLYQSLFYARMQLVHHANPYTVLPAAFAGDPWFPYLGWPRQVSVYGPLWSMAMAGVVAVAGHSLVRGLLLAKTVEVALEGLTVWGLVHVRASENARIGGDAGRRQPAGAHGFEGDPADARIAVAAFALNPLVLSAIPLSGHPDAAVAAGLVWAMVADRHGRPILSSLLLAAAALVKAYAGVALLVYLAVRWRRGGPASALRSGGAAAAFAAIAFAPYWAGPRIFTGLLSIAGETSNSLAGAIDRLLASGLVGLDVRGAAAVAAAGVRVAGTAILVLALVRLARSPGTARDPWPAVAVLLATYLLVTPWFLPWHAIGLIALVCALPESRVSSPALVFSGSCLASVGAPGLLGALATATARYGPPIVTGLSTTR